MSPEVALPRTATSTALAALAVSVGPLDPAFAPDVSDYVVHGVNRLTPIEVSVSARAPEATLQVNGVPVLDGLPVRLTLGAGEDLTITSVAPGAALQETHVRFSSAGVPPFTVTSAPGAGREPVLLTPGFTSLLAVDRDGAVRYFQDLGNRRATDFKEHHPPEGGTVFSYIGTDPSGLTVPQVHLLDGLLRETASVRLLPHGDHGELDPDVHDFLVLGAQHYVAVAYHQRFADLGALDPSWKLTMVTAGVVQEIDHGQVVFEWESTAVPSFFEDSTEGNAYGEVGSHDYVHLNSVTIDPVDGDFVVSLRHTDSVVKLDRATGQVVWTLGGRSDDFGLTAEQRFAHQHYARYDATHRLVLFDNGNDLHQSRAVAFTLDEGAHQVREFEVLYEKPADQPQTTFMGSVEVLPQGRTFIGWGGWPVGELAPPSATEVVGGVPVWSLTFQNPGLFSYRATVLRGN